MLILTLDNLATRYHSLPSEIIGRADTFDLYVMDIASKYQRYQNDKAQGKESTAKVPRPSEAEMLKMLERVKNEK